MNDESPLRFKIPRQFEEVLQGILTCSAEIAQMVLIVGVKNKREKFGDYADLVKAGRLVPQLVLRGGALEISLIDAETGANIGTVFQYGAPALEARGVAN